MHGTDGSFNYFLVFLSYIISVCGAFTALVLARESVRVSGPERLPWVTWSAVIMGGIGIWSMHFVGMMAYHTDMPVNYDISLTVLSLLLGIVSTGIGFAIVGLGSRTLLAIILAGLFMGSGVAGMHYMGMAAMQTSATITYNMPIVWLSLGIAVSASCVALWMAFFLDRALANDGGCFGRRRCRVRHALHAWLYHYDARCCGSRTTTNGAVACSRR